MRIAIVLPFGSRVATSRINFRLLSRDATLNGKRLSVVAGDAATRALAASAGLPVFSTVAEYETSEDGGIDPTMAAAGAAGAMAARSSRPTRAPARPHRVAVVDAVHEARPPRHRKPASPARAMTKASRSPPSPRRARAPQP